MCGDQKKATKHKNKFDAQQCDTTYDKKKNTKRETGKTSIQRSTEKLTQTHRKHKPVGLAVITLVGVSVGAGEGAPVGSGEGTPVGIGDGSAVGVGVGDTVGTGDGESVGVGEGIAVGIGVGPKNTAQSNTAQSKHV